jgi:hypothetical protein
MLMLELIRDGLARHYGIQCLHEARDRKYARKIGVFYCSSCGTFFDRREGPKGITWTPTKVTWELDAVIQRPTGPLEFDLR